MTTRNAARTIAALLLLQAACGPIVNFVLLKWITASAFLEQASAHATEIGLAVVIGLAMHAFAVGIAVVALPVLRTRSVAMASWLLAFAVVGFAGAVVEYSNSLSMLSFSQAFAKADAPGADVLRTLAPGAAAPRIWAHFIGLMIAGGFAFTLYAALFRFALVPRVLAGFGALAACSEIIAVAMPLFGQPVVFPMIAPLGLAHLALVVWLLAKGFAEPATARA
ncbi:MAG TPA: DUF4386 family protein [Rhodanobacteraceae bacterium]|nr:DUF4386 family protein [Rhodanobacteraceae bacterium]